MQMTGKASQSSRAVTNLPWHEQASSAYSEAWMKPTEGAKVEVY